MSDWERRSTRTTGRTVQKSFVGCLLATLLASAMATSAGAETRPHVLLITVDTLRADYLGCYGFGHDTSPNIDALARRGTLYEDAITTIGKTGPAFASLFTSLYPPTHGARRNGMASRSDVPILAEVLKGEGYTTAAFITNWTLKNRLAALARGFDHYDERFDRERNSFGAAERDAATVTQAALAWLQTNRASDASPLFLWVHYSDPHSPYELRPAYAVPQPETKSSGWNKRWKYASEVGYADHWIGFLMRHAASYFPAESTYILFLSDHGESLGEHQFWGHGKNAHWPNLRIPLILVGPGIPAGERSPQPASIIDVLPTVLELLAIDPPAGIEGISLSPGRPAPPDPDRLRFALADRITALGKKSRNRYEDPLAISLQTPRVKTIYNFSRRMLEYFDLTMDPREETPLAAPPVDSRPPIRRRLVSWYQALGKYEASRGAELSSEDLKQLKSLGYLGQ